MNKKVTYLCLLIVLLIIISLFLFNKKDPATLNGMIERFNNTNTKGGILCNNFGIEWFEAMLNRGDITLTDTSVCAHVNRKTCTAYSLLRKDLIPMLFIQPGKENNVPCGIILDTEKVWPLITLMATVDADTNNRNCCTNESGSPILVRNPLTGTNRDWCTYQSMLKQKEIGNLTDEQLNYAVYIPSIDKGFTNGTCNNSCSGDKRCMYNNSGGNINQWLMMYSDECKDGKYSNCFEFENIPTSEVPQSIKDALDAENGGEPDGWLIQKVTNDCSICDKPYLCVFDEAPSGTPYQTVEEIDRIANYIGPDGKGFQKTVTNTMKIGDIAIKQCRFEKTDWDKWINVVRQYYKDLLGLLNSDNSVTKPEFNYMLANPDIPSYFENEVNLYINPDVSSSDFQTQNKIWQDSIIGFYYTSSTCDEQLGALDNIPTGIYNNAKERCDQFYKDLTTAGRKQWENDRIEYSRKLVHQVQKLFNKKYNKSIPVYKSSPDSNAYPNYNSLVTALKKQTKLDNIFVLDTE